MLHEATLPVATYEEEPAFGACLNEKTFNRSNRRFGGTVVRARGPQLVCFRRAGHRDGLRERHCGPKGDGSEQSPSATNHVLLPSQPVLHSGHRGLKPCQATLRLVSQIDERLARPRR